MSTDYRSSIIPTAIADAARLGGLWFDGDELFITVSRRMIFALSMDQRCYAEAVDIEHSVDEAAEAAATLDERGEYVCTVRLRSDGALALLDLRRHGYLMAEEAEQEAREESDTLAYHQRAYRRAVL